MHKFLHSYMLQSSTCFEQNYANHQEVKLYVYSIWNRHSLWVVVVVVYDHHNHSQRVTIPYAVYIQFDLLMISIILLETYRGL